MAVVRTACGSVEPDYFQFYVRRTEDLSVDTSVPDRGYEAHLWSTGLWVYVGTCRKLGTTVVTVEVLDGPPTGPDPGWQHVAEVSLDAGGAVKLMNWEGWDPALEVDVDPGPLRLRVGWRGLVAGRFEGMDDNDESDEELLLQLWSAPVAPLQTIRRWVEWELPTPTEVSPNGRRQIEGLDRVMDRLGPMIYVGFRIGLDEIVLRPSPVAELRSLSALQFDPADGSWWADGYDVRRTLREVSEVEVASLVANGWVGSWIQQLGPREWVLRSWDGDEPIPAWYHEGRRALSPHDVEALGRVGIHPRRS